MMNGGTPVKVVVTEAALKAAVPPNALDRSIFTHRRAFEKLANEKAVRSLFEDDGSIVIRPMDLDIRTADSRYA